MSRLIDDLLQDLSAKDARLVLIGPVAAQPASSLPLAIENDKRAQGKYEARFGGRSILLDSTEFMTLKQAGAQEEQVARYVVYGGERIKATAYGNAEYVRCYDSAEDCDVLVIHHVSTLDGRRFPIFGLINLTHGSDALAEDALSNVIRDTVKQSSTLAPAIR